MSPILANARPPGAGADPVAPETVLRRFRQAKDRRTAWESHWDQCYAYALPQRDGALAARPAGERKTERLFDSTAADAVEQLAASLLAELTPPWSRWFGLTPGPAVTQAESGRLAPLLESAERVLQGHLARSNFAVEMHQCYLDLVTVGTACLLFEETALGAPSAFRFTAVPLGEAVLEEGPDGRLDATFRRSKLTHAQLRQRYPEAELPPALLAAAEESPDRRFALVEAVLPDGAAYDYLALLEETADDAGTGERSVLARGRFGHSPFVNFRWMKAPGEIYGRSPVMKALPDIKTANKVVELTLKNASIAVTGIWQADDDGVLNPASVRLQPGTIIPKAVGSAGLTPLQPAGKFDVSQLILEDLRRSIRHALLVDKLAPVDSPRMTATEVLERAGEMNRLLGATFGRLQAELLTPLVGRALSILRRRGEIAEIAIDGRLVDLAQRSPLAQVQARKDLGNVLFWLEQAAQLGPQALAVVDGERAARWSAEILGVPGDLLRPPGQAAGPMPTGAGPAGGPVGGLVGDPAALLAELQALLTGQPAAPTETPAPTSPMHPPTSSPEQEL